MTILPPRRTISINRRKTLPPRTRGKFELFEEQSNPDLEETFSSDEQNNDLDIYYEYYSDVYMEKSFKKLFLIILIYDRNSLKKEHKSKFPVEGKQGNNRSNKRCLKEQCSFYFEENHRFDFEENCCFNEEGNHKNDFDKTVQ